MKTPRPQPEPQPEPHDALAARLTRALEAAPTVTIPANFAARLATRAAAELPRNAPIVPRRFSTLAIQITFVALALAMLAIAHSATTHTLFPIAIELLLACEFVALITWRSLRPDAAR